MKSLWKKIIRALGYVAIKISPFISPALATKVSVWFYGKLGMRFRGVPNYISSRVNFDGTDYGEIEIQEGVTISSYVRVLTHDWALYTVAKAAGYFSDKPIGRLSGVSIGAYSFVGTASVIMPGAKIGKGCLIAAGTVVRGEVPDYSIVIGSPGVIVGSTKEYIRRQFDRLHIQHHFDLD